MNAWISASVWLRCGELIVGRKNSRPPVSLSSVSSGASWKNAAWSPATTAVSEIPAERNSRVSSSAKSDGGGTYSAISSVEPYIFTVSRAAPAPSPITPAVCTITI